MEQHLFDELKTTLGREGPLAAIDRLCTALREKKDYASLFYAMLMKKRHELGVSPVPTSSALDLPPAVHAAYEEAIREAGRVAGRLFLDEGNIPNAFAYFRMIGETEPVVGALEKYQPAEGDDIQQLVDIAYYQGVSPKKGFDLILDRYGICSAITTLGGGEFPHGVEARAYCVKRLVRALYQELLERLSADIARQEGTAPTAKSVRELIATRDWLFGEDYYHIDISHLGSVVQMSIHLSPGEELELAREMCEYGQRLAPQFHYKGEPPFEDQYRDYGVYLSVLAGDKVDEGLAHFRAKVEDNDPQTVGTYPAEVYVNLLLRAGRPQEALAVSRKYLAQTDDRRLACPGFIELCEKAKDYRTLAEVARELNNPVHFMAGLLAEKK